MEFVITPPVLPTLPVFEVSARFPVRRIFCVGRNYADHAREMGAAAQAEGLEPPFFFMKPADALVAGEGELAVAYPPMTQNLHHEMELVAALGRGGTDIPEEEALSCVYGYTAGLDLTRRDIQGKAKEKGHPWDMGKGFDQSAVAGVLQPATRCGHPFRGRIWLTVNGQVRQDGDLSQMGWSVAQIVSNLSRFVTLAAGDLIYTGTPAGVGAVVPGDVLEGGIDGVCGLKARIVNR